MVIRHQHLQPERLGGGNALKTGDAVVHGDEHIRPAVFDALGDGRGQAVAVHHAVGHDVVDVLRAQQTQTAYSDGAGGRAIAVVIRHDAEALVLRDGVS